jgi:hypothetical protein
MKKNKNKKHNETPGKLKIFLMFIKSKGIEYKEKLISDLKKLKGGLAQEGKQTQEMLEIYLRFTQGEASKEELKVANVQFRDFLKTLGLSVLIVVPFAPLTIPFTVKLAKLFGIDIIPSSFTDKKGP